MKYTGVAVACRFEIKTSECLALPKPSKNLMHSANVISNAGPAKRSFSLPYFVAPNHFFTLSTNGNAAVNIEVVSSDVIGGRVESKEPGHTGNLLGLSKSLERDALRNLLQVILAKLRSHVGLNETGAEAVDGDTTSGKLLGIAHGQTDDTTLGGGVVGLAGVADLSDNTGDVDNAAGALLGGNLEEGLGAVEDTGEVDVDDGLPLLGLHSHNEGVGGNAGVVDQDIAGAVLLHNLVEHSLDLIRIGAYFIHSRKKTISI